MSENRTHCEQIDQWIVERSSDEIPPELSGHLERCACCRQQAVIHQSLVAAFAGEDVPDLSSSFEEGLERKLAAARVDSRPLAGWRRAAMIAYGAAAAGIVGWALRDVPLPTIDVSAPWVPVVAFIAVPLTLMLAVAASRWLPAPASLRGLRAFLV